LEVMEIAYKCTKTTFECSLPTAIQKMLDVHLRDGVTRFFASGSFHDSSFPKSLKITLVSFQFCLNCRYICKSKCTTVINNTSGKFAACVNYTGGIFATCTAGVIDTGGKFDTGGKVATAINDTVGNFARWQIKGTILDC
jgi:hypothetical protein